MRAFYKHGSPPSPLLAPYCCWQDTQEGRCIHDLPHELLVLIMQAVPQQHRLSACTQVCTAWHAAALSATVHLEISCASQATCTALAAWLQRTGRAGALESLHIWSGAIDYEHQPTLVMPSFCFSSLLKLWLDRTNLAMVPAPALAPWYAFRPAATHGASAAAAALCSTAAPTAGPGPYYGTPTTAAMRRVPATMPPATTAGAAAAAVGLVLGHPYSNQQVSWPCAAAAAANLAVLSSLTELHLTDCLMAAEGLQELTALQSLELALLVLPGDWIDLHDAAERLTVCEAVARDSLAALTQLTNLALGGMYCTDSIMAEVSSLQHLQKLALFAPELSADALKLPLPGSITSLAITAGSDPYRFHLDLHPTNLLISAEGTPAITRLTSLQHLRLAAVCLHLDALASLAQLTALELCSCSLTKRDTTQAAAVNALAGLTNLQRLVCACDDVDQRWTTADISALTTISRLTFLDLTGCESPGGTGRSCCNVSSSHATTNSSSNGTMDGISTITASGSSSSSSGTSSSGLAGAPKHCA